MTGQQKRGFIFLGLYALIVLFLSVMPTDFAEDKKIFLFHGFDKLVHVGMYGLFSFLVINQYLVYRKIKWGAVALWMLAVLGYSLLMELIQLLFTDYRSGELLDVLANISGIIAGGVFRIYLKKIKS